MKGKGGEGQERRRTEEEILTFMAASFLHLSFDTQRRLMLTLLQRLLETIKGGATRVHLPFDGLALGTVPRASQLVPQINGPECDQWGALLNRPLGSY